MEDNGLNAEIYPQGSFAFGTVVRPSINDSQASYDLDFICQVTSLKTDHTPKSLRDKVEIVLKSDKTYADRLKVYDTCFTIQYADIGEIGFSIDIVPAVDESDEIKKRLIKKSSLPYLINTAIAIPKYSSELEYEWITNNPKGFRKWFEDINLPFLTSAKETEKMRILKENISFYASIEEIPNDLIRSALQKVIQILKWHRNQYYTNLTDGNDIKPISAILVVATTKIAKHCEPNCTFFELLKYILNEFTVYGEYQSITESQFILKHGKRNVFSRPGGKWYIENPANPEDNLADHWNEDIRVPKAFFQWIENVKKDFITSLEKVDDEQFRIILENSFGEIEVSKVLGNKYRGKITPRIILPQTSARPYGIQ